MLGRGGGWRAWHWLVGSRLAWRRLANGWLVGDWSGSCRPSTGWRPTVGQPVVGRPRAGTPGAGLPRAGRPCTWQPYVHLSWVGRLVAGWSAAAWQSGVCHLGVSSASGYPVGSSVGRGLAHRRVGPLAGQPTGGAVRWRVGPRAGQLAGGWPAECLSDGAGQPGVGPLTADWARVGWVGLAGHRVARLGPDSRGRLRLRSLSRGSVSLG